MLDDDRNVVFQKHEQPRPAGRSVAYEVGGDRRSDRPPRGDAGPDVVRGKEAQTFKSLAQFVQSGATGTPRSRPCSASRQRLAEGRGQAAARQPRRLHPQAAGDGADHARSARRAATRRRPGRRCCRSTRPRRVRKELGELGVRVIRIGTVPDQMLYDKERIVVQAGKPVEIVFENTDLMPHNFVVAQARRAGRDRHAGRGDGHAARRGRAELRARIEQDAAREPAASAARAAEAQLHRPERAGRLSLRLHLSRPLAADVRGAVRRRRPGRVPGRPEGYLATHPLPIEDELLKFNRPRRSGSSTNWPPPSSRLEHGRSFANGKQMFPVASCVACHKMDGVGTRSAPT